MTPRHALSALHDAVRAGDARAVAELTHTHGTALLDAPTPPHGERALTLALQAGHLHIAETLLVLGADPNPWAMGTGTALHWTAHHNAHQAARTLLAHGANPACLNGENCTPAHIAISRGHAETLQALLDAGLSPDAALADGRSLLHMAAARGSLACAERLCRAGARAHARDIDGRTPADIAHQAGATRLAEMLRAQARTEALDASERARPRTPGAPDPGL